MIINIYYYDNIYLILEKRFSSDFDSCGGKREKHVRTAKIHQVTSSSLISLTLKIIEKGQISSEGRRTNARNAGNCSPVWVPK